MGGAGVLRQRGRDQRARLPAARPTVRTRQVQARHKRRVLDGNENIFFFIFLSLRYEQKKCKKSYEISCRGRLNFFLVEGKDQRAFGL